MRARTVDGAIATTDVPTDPKPDNKSWYQRARAELVDQFSWNRNLIMARTAPNVSQELRTRVEDARGKWSEAARTAVQDLRKIEDTRQKNEHRTVDWPPSKVPLLNPERGWRVLAPSDHRASGVKR